MCGSDKLRAVVGGRANVSLFHCWQVTKMYDVGHNLACDDDEKERGGGTKNLAAGGQLALNEDCVFVMLLL